MILFTRLKHWQIFVLMFGLEILIKLSATFRLISPAFFLQIIPMAVWFSLVMIFLWLMSIDHLLAQHSNTGQSERRTFKIICSAVIVLQLYLAITQSFYGQFESSWLRIITWICFGVLLYACLRVGRLVKTYESGHLASLNEFFSTALLFLISPIGVWIIQPKINLIVDPVK